MSVQTMFTKKQQELWCLKNDTSIIHRLSARGNGNSAILNSHDEVISKASGCGYDRYGAALGEAIMTLFGPEVLKLAKRECKGRNRRRKESRKFYGMFYNAIKGTAYLDGACGVSSMERILNKIGFSLDRVGSTGSAGNTGKEFYTLVPVKPWAKAYL